MAEKQNSGKIMGFDEFYGHYVEEYLPQYYLFFPGKGYIVWRLGTGENIELLHVRSFQPGKKLGVRIVRAMLREIGKRKPPFYSVWGFALASNETAIRWYQSMGFNTEECAGPYKGGPSIVFWQSFEKLCEELLAGGDDDPELMSNVVKSQNLR